MGLWDTVEFAHMALRLVPEILDPVDVVLLVGGKRISSIIKVRFVDHLKALELVGKHIGVQALSEKSTIEIIDKAIARARECAAANQSQIKAA